MGCIVARVANLTLFSKSMHRHFGLTRKIRKCCINKGYHTCAECECDVRECKTYSNFISKVFALLFNSDRPACIRYIKEHGEIAYAEEMAKRKCQTIKRK